MISVVESRPRSLHDAARGPHRATGRAADRARDVAGGGRLSRNSARGSRWLRPHRRALTGAMYRNDRTRHRRSRRRANSAWRRGALKPLLPVVAAVCALLALWFGWSGWQQYQAANAAQSTVTKARDDGRQADRRVGRSSELAQLDTAPRVAGRAGGARARRPRRAAAGARPGLGGCEPVADPAPTDLSAEYAALPKLGFGKLGVLEAAIAENKPVAAMVRDGGGPQPGAGRAGASGEQVASAWPTCACRCERATRRIESGDVSRRQLPRPAPGRLQRRSNAATRSSGRRRRSARRAGAGHRPARRRGGSRTRPTAPFGLGAMPCWIAALVFARAGWLLAWRRSRPSKLAARQGRSADADRAIERARRLAERRASGRAGLPRAAAAGEPPKPRAVDPVAPAARSRSTAASSAPTTSAAWSGRRSMPASPN